MKITKIEILCKPIDSDYEYGNEGLLNTGLYKIFYDDGTSKITDTLYMSHSNSTPQTKRVTEFS